MLKLDDLMHGEEDNRGASFGGEEPRQAGHPQLRELEDLHHECGLRDLFLDHLDQHPPSSTFLHVEEEPSVVPEPSSQVEEQGKSHKKGRAKAINKSRN